MPSSNLSAFRRRAPAKRELQGGYIYGHHRDRVFITHPLDSGGPGVLLAHRKVFEPKSPRRKPKDAQVSDTPIIFNDDDR